MHLVVVGFSPDGDLSVLHTALEAAQLPSGPLQVVHPDDGTRSLSAGLAGAGGLTNVGGTGVPGINGGSGRARQFFRNESLSDRLGDFKIPDSQIDNYVEALERGRRVVAYFASAETVDRVEAIFREASLLNVRRF